MAMRATVPRSLVRTCSKGVRTHVTHAVELPSCCPVSRNPLPGSELSLSYHPLEAVLPVEMLRDMIASYVGGNRERGIFGMESMIQDLAIRSAAIVGVPVRAIGRLVIEPFPGGGPLQRMMVRVRAKP